jgi:hypothetical protein
MPERVRYNTEAIAPQHLSHRQECGRSGLYGSIECGIRVFDRQIERHSSARQRDCGRPAHPRKLIGNEEDTIANLHGTVRELRAIRHGHSDQFFSSEGSLVELDGSVGIIYYERRRYRMKLFRRRANAG